MRISGLSVYLRRGLAWSVTCTLLLLIGCGGGSTTTSAPPPPPPPPSVAITALSSTSPVALTPLQISTAGLSAGVAVTVTFFDNSGFSVTENAIRVASDGTVIAAVPLFTTTNGQTGSGSVSVTISQGNITSLPTSLTIQDLPSVGSYGMQPGQITHGFLIYQAMRIARRLNELQAFQYFPGNTVDTTQAQATLRSLLRDVQISRNDVDRVALNSSLAISAGTLSDGTPMQFDQTSLDMMDRTIGLYLTTQMASAMKMATESRRSHSPRRRRLHKSKSDHYFSAESCGTGAMCSLINFLDTANNLTAITQTTSDLTLKQEPNSFDKPLSIASGLAAIYALAGSPGTSKIPWVGPALGALISGGTLLNAFGQELGDLAFVMVASRNGGDPQVIQQAWNDIHDQGIAAGIAALQTEISLAQFGGAAAKFTADAVAVLTSGAGTLALQSANLIAGLAGCATSECLTGIENVSTQVAGAAQNIFSSATQGFAEVTGLNNITFNNQDPSLSPETGVLIFPFDNGQQIDGIADPSGSYDLFVPLQSPSTDYSNLTANAFDWITGLNLAAENIDLAGLTTASPQQLPTMQGTCNDTDASNPDGDDPDCD